MAPMTNQELDALEEVLHERKLSKQVFNAAGDLYGNVSQLPPLPGKTEKDMDERLFGSRSYEFVDVSECMLYSQLEVTTRSQAKQQIILLQVSSIFLHIWTKHFCISKSFTNRRLAVNIFLLL